MDPICHTLVGGTLAHSGLKHRTRLGTATLLLGANLPDVDIVSAWTDSDLGFRRGWTHGVLAWVVLPLVLTVLMLGWDRLRRPADASAPPLVPPQVLLLATLAVLTHPFLDWLNVYGIRLLMPFSGRWFYGDSLVIVDPLLWLLLGSGLAVSLVRSRRGTPAAERPSRLGLGLAASYIVFMIGTSLVGRHVAMRDLNLKSDPGPRALMVAPAFLDPLRREVILSLPDRYWFGEIRWRPRPELALTGNHVLKAFDDPRVALVTPTHASRQLLAWARFPYYMVEGADRGKVLRLDDARYGFGRRSWAAVIWPLQSSAEPDSTARPPAAAPPRPPPG